MGKKTAMSPRVWGSGQGVIGSDNISSVYPISLWGGRVGLVLLDGIGANEMIDLTGSVGRVMQRRRAKGAWPSPGKGERKSIQRW